MAYIVIIQGDALKALDKLKDKTIDCCVNSPPYFQLRDYGIEGQIGLELTPEEYIKTLSNVYIKLRDKLKDSGTLWINIAGSYWGTGTGQKSTGKASFVTSDYPQDRPKKHPVYKPKDWIPIPWLLGIRLQRKGYYLRNDCIIKKRNGMVYSVKDRMTPDHEYMLFLSKNRKYYYDYEAILEDCITQEKRSKRIEYKGKGSGASTFLPRREDNKKNKRTVWELDSYEITNCGIKDKHFAAFPKALPLPAILAGSPVGGVVMDCFLGSGTSAIVAYENKRNFIGIELNPEYVKIAVNRIQKETGYEKVKVITV